MKKSYFLFLLFLAGFTANAQDEFIFTYNHPEGFIELYLFNYEDTDYTIDFGDGTVMTNPDLSISPGYLQYYFESPGLHTVTMTGNLPRIRFEGEMGLISIEQWGNNAWRDMSYMFYEQLANIAFNATDTPNLTQCNSMAHMFDAAHNFNQPINNWDVSHVKNMEGMFKEVLYFNQPLDNWDVSNVQNMSEMFYSSWEFNQPLNNWNVSNVTDMSGMFNSTPFNQPLDNWDVSNVTDMSGMFDSTPFNQPLNSWDVSNVTDMRNMFFGAFMFNQPLGNWDVSGVTNMNGMFYASDSFDQPLNTWNVSNVTDMNNMFRNINAFNQDLSSWNFNSGVNLLRFVDNSFGLDADNYDALLLRFVQLELENKTFEAHSLYYCDAGVRNYLIEELGWSITGDSQSESCDGNTVSGSVTFDANNNNCGAGSTPASNIVIRGTDGTYNYYSVSSATGAYDLKVMEGTYSIAPQNLPDYFTATPVSGASTFTGFNNTETLNFCLSASQQVDDLNVTILPMDEARPGEDSHYKIVVNNLGTQTVSNTSITFTYDAAIQQFISASTTPATNTAGQLTFTVNNLAPFAQSNIDITLTTFIPPAVNGGEVIGFMANVTPDSNDYTPNDNTFTYNQTVVNSYDPNDKLVLQGDAIDIDDAAEYLDYIIRFQNTGSASALKVVIRDELNEMLDWDSFQPVSASHSYQMALNEDGELTFTFNNINLPHEGADEAGSHGYIAYKIRPVEGVQVGDIINGEEAKILFDYNMPIITNATTTEVIDFAGTPQFAGSSIKLYPNPAGDYLYIDAKGSTIEQLTIYNLQGSEVLNTSTTTQPIAINNLSKGLYIVTVKTGKGSSTYKLLKQ